MGLLTTLNNASPFSLHFTILTLAGFWHLETDKNWKRIAYTIYKFLNVFSVTTVMFMQIIDVYHLKFDSTKKTERLGATIITCLIGLRTHITLHNTEKYFRLQAKLATFRDSNSKHPDGMEIVQETSKEILKNAKVFYVSAMAAVLFWTFTPLLEAERRLPFRYRFPANIQQTPVYEILYVYMAFVLITFTLNVVSNTLGYCSYLIQINSHFEILKKMIENITRAREEVVAEKRLLAEFKIKKIRHKKLKMEDKEKEERLLQDERTFEIFKEVIKTQNYITEEIKSFKELYSLLTLLHITGVLLGFAIVEISGTSEDVTLQFVKRFFNVTLGVFDILLICHYGNELKYKSAEIVHALYLIPWHEMDRRLQRILIIMKIRALKYSVLKAGETIRLDLATFLSVLRVGYNFMVLLRHTVNYTT